MPRPYGRIRAARQPNAQGPVVFTGPGGGPGRRGGPSVPRATRTVLSRHNLHRTYQSAVAKLADPAVPLRPTARRVLWALRDAGPQPVDLLAARLSATGRRPIRPATVADALGELHVAGLAAVDVDDQDVAAVRWSAVPATRDPLLEGVDLHGAHDFRHTYATSLPLPLPRWRWHWPMARPTWSWPSAAPTRPWRI
jgi:hypothetical protein